MFFVPHILLFLFIYPTPVNSLDFNMKNKYQDAFQAKSTTSQTHGEDWKSATNFTNHNFLFQIIQNLTNTKAKNLKSNVFDKMLSDEMLSIKKHVYIRSTMPVQASIKHPATPTLHLRQNWPLIGFTEKPDKVIRNDNSLKNNDKIAKILPGFKIGENFDDIPEESKSEKKNEKVLGLRSLRDEDPIAQHPSYRRHGDNFCTCQRTSTPSTTCSHRSSCGDVSSSCSHTTICAHCTRNSPPLYTVPNVYYQPYFVGVTTQLPFMGPYPYYHPDVINELKVPRKPKHRKTTKMYIDENLYYSSDDRNKLPDRHEDNYFDDYLDYYKDVRKPEANDESGNAIKIHLIEYDDKEKKKHKHKRPKCNHHVKKKHREKLVDDLFDDLKTYYSDSVIKDCYCRSSSWVVKVNIFLLFAVCLVNIQ